MGPCSRSHPFARKSDCTRIEGNTFPSRLSAKLLQVLHFWGIGILAIKVFRESVLPEKEFLQGNTSLEHQHVLETRMR